MSQILSDGRCAHCYVVCHATGGCVTCNSSRTFCTCGALLRCGCGMTFEHEPDRCPNIITSRVIMLPASEYNRDVVVIPLTSSIVFCPSALPPLS